MKIGDIIRFLRKGDNLTQKQLGEKLGVTGHNVFDWEKGKCEPPSEILKRLAALFGVTVGYLIGAEDEFGCAPSDLTEEDRKLLAYYHGMDPTQQRAILRTAESFYVDNQANSKRLS